MVTNLYNAALAALPSAQGWLSFGNTLLGSQTRTPNGVLLSSLPSLANAAGFSNVSALLPMLVNPGFPQLDPARGFALGFRLRILDEQHLADNRAGFSAILQGMGSAPLGIELGFWRDRIASLLGGDTPLQTVGAWVGGLDLSQNTAFSLRIFEQTFSHVVFSSGRGRTSGRYSIGLMIPWNWPRSLLMAGPNEKTFSLLHNGLLLEPPVLFAAAIPCLLKRS